MRRHQGSPVPTAAGTAWPALILFVLGCAIVVVATLELNGGQFSYPLDDSYIHLALAENIARGHYGINASDRAAPSSSILWPFILAPLAGTGVDHYLPLILGVLAGGATILVFRRFLGVVFGSADGPRQRRAITVGTVLLVLATNVIGLAVSGMEHSMQLLLTSLLLWGMIGARESGRLSWWLIPVLVLGPLVRYENLAVSVPALAVLALRGHVRASVLGAVFLGGALLVFTYFLWSSGLGLLPTSVLEKSDVVAAGGTIQAIASNVLKNLTASRQGALCGIGALALLLVLMDVRREGWDRALAAWGAAAVGLHLLVGRYGWLNRYEIYVWFVMLMTLVYLHRDAVRGLATQRPDYKAGAIALGAVLATSLPYVYGLAELPLAANNIYEQQYQMHRFATRFYRAPIAVNDVGWASYRNDAYVLDLRGIGSQQAYEARRRREDESRWIPELMKTHEVRFAMLYDSWFRNLPESWIPVGSLRLGKRRVSPSGDIVTFYALDDETYRSTRAQLVEFSRTLPPGVRFVLRDKR